MTYINWDPSGKGTFVVRDYIIRQWQYVWDETLVGRDYHGIVSKVSSKVKFYAGVRRDDVVLTRLRMGHAKLNACLYRIGKHPDGLCDVCREPETVQHYLFDCIRFQHQQLVLVEEAVKLEVPVSLSGMLGCKDFGPSVVAYVKATGRYYLL